MGVHRHYNPERAIHNRVAKPKRAKRRAEARERFERQLRKQREIGIDPIYRRRPDLHDAWIKKSRAWDQANSSAA